MHCIYSIYIYIYLSWPFWKLHSRSMNFYCAVDERVRAGDRMHMHIHTYCMAHGELRAISNRANGAQQTCHSEQNAPTMSWLALAVDSAQRSGHRRRYSPLCVTLAWCTYIAIAIFFFLSLLYSNFDSCCCCCRCWAAVYIMCMHLVAIIPCKSSQLGSNHPFWCTTNIYIYIFYVCYSYSHPSAT